jgi:chromate transporter
MQSTGTNDNRPAPRVHEIFFAFLLIGATSFGGAVVAHVRNNIVSKRQWIDDRTFVELLTISQTLPGLITANMAMLIGDRLAGTFGATAALAGVCLPGALLMFVVGMMFQAERRRPLVEAALQGVAPAAVGMLLATTMKIARSSLSRVGDLLFMVATVVCVNRLHLSVPRALICVGVVATLWYGLAAKRGRPT